MIIGMTMSSFRERNIKWRNMSSPLPLRRINFELTLGNLVVSIMIWLIYVIISLILYYKVIFSINGLLLIVNSFVFMICALSLGFLIGNVVKNQQANSSISNVVSLGSSFLCGAFVPQSMLGESVLKFSRIFPSYWFIKNNDYIVSINKYSTSNLITIFTNMLIVLVFALLFYIITQVVTKKLFKNS
jgi:ABC-2 type transport system permease protein